MKMQKKKIGGGGAGVGWVGGLVGGGQGGCERRNKVFVKIKKKKLGGGGGGGVGSGVRVDVNEGLKFCENSKKKKYGGVRGGSGLGWGGQGGCE